MPRQQTLPSSRRRRSRSSKRHFSITRIMSSLSRRSNSSLSKWNSNSSLCGRSSSPSRKSNSSLSRRRCLSKSSSRSSKSLSSLIRRRRKGSMKISERRSGNSPSRSSSNSLSRRSGLNRRRKLRCQSQSCRRSQKSLGPPRSAPPLHHRHQSSPSHQLLRSKNCAVTDETATNPASLQLERRSYCHRKRSHPLPQLRRHRRCHRQQMQSPGSLRHTRQQMGLSRQQPHPRPEGHSQRILQHHLCLIQVLGWQLTSLPCDHRRFLMSMCG
mmetsp:Transcript_55627/g.132599  ORF Transcript_55627/g.132599 Transcript_55627/m.132599 type:complete len:270 (+) Transcript_55627:865-1674(+)